MLALPCAPYLWQLWQAVAVAVDVTVAGAAADALAVDAAIVAAAGTGSRRAPPWTEACAERARPSLPPLASLGPQAIMADKRMEVHAWGACLRNKVVGAQLRSSTCSPLTD